MSTQSISKRDLEEAIRNCDRAPIHLPGGVQGFGHLFAADPKLHAIEVVSEPIAALGAGGPGELLGAPPEALLDAETTHAIRNALGHATIETQRELVGSVVLAGQALQISAHRQGGRAIVELIPERASAAAGMRAIDQARRFLKPDLAPDAVEDLDALFEEAVERLRALTGHDRVMAYRFLPDGSGEIVAETRRPDIGSFLGRRFPATDIPPRARVLYAATPIRVLADVAAENAPLRARDPEAPPLDLSLAVLRGADPVHSQYLRNMGVRSTLTLPIVVDGRLWGLFAAHHMSPLAPDPGALMAAELAGKLLSLRVGQAVERRRAADLRRAEAVAKTVIVPDDSALAAGGYLAAAREELARLLPCAGGFLSVDGETEGFGVALEPTSRTALLALADPTAPEGVTAIDDLQIRLPGAAWGDVGGALILGLSETPAIRLVFLRLLTERAIPWAGAPDKAVRLEADGPRLEPRASFETYVETVRGRSDEWSSGDLQTAAALRLALVRALGLRQELKDNRHRLGLMVRELNHRVRNILALVQSLSTQSRAGAQTVDAFATVLERRIIALAAAHDLLTSEEAGGADLAEIAQIELRPYATAARAEIAGPDVRLDADAAPILSLILHELTSNAVKYGALSSGVGRVSLRWEAEPDGLTIRWREAGGPPVRPPERRGFGRTIIESAIPYECHGQSTLRFEEGGVVAEFQLPPERFTRPPTSADAPPRPPPPAGRRARTTESPTPAAGGRALVVEDNFIIAMQARSMVLGAGFAEVDTAATVAEALHLVGARHYDFCLLDLDLQGEMSTPIAEALRRRGAPFLFATGYGAEGAEVLKRFDAPMVAKPLDAREVAAQIAVLLEAAGR